MKDLCCCVNDLSTPGRRLFTAVAGIVLYMFGMILWSMLLLPAYLSTCVLLAWHVSEKRSAMGSCCCYGGTAQTSVNNAIDEESFIKYKHRLPSLYSCVVEI